MLTDDEVAQFKRDGFLLVKKVFTPEEVARFRSIGGEADADLSSLPGMDTLWADERLTRIASRLLGGPIAYFGEASYRYGDLSDGHYAAGRLHHDAKGTIEHLFNRQHLPTPDPYPIVRFAFYLQDYTRHSGGLKVAPGSHQFDSSDFDLAKLSYVDVPSEPGDAVVFCNKILHAALALKPKAGPSISPPEQTRQYALQPDAFFDRHLDRRVFFIDFAGNNELADIYIKSRALHPSNLRDGFADLAASDRLPQLAASAGVRLRMDAAVVEAVTKIYALSPGGRITDEAKKYAATLPALCRLSQSWSPYYDFVPAAPAGDDVKTGLTLAMELGSRINALRAALQTARVDTAMLPPKNKAGGAANA